MDVHSLITFVVIQMIHTAAAKVLPTFSTTVGSPIKEETVTSNPKLCWKSETFLIISECAPCSSSEKVELSVCKETGNKQLVKCQKANSRTYVSCPVALSFERKRFWTFEALSLTGAVLSNMIVWWRRRKLNHFHYQRVKRQMSSAI